MSQFYNCCGVEKPNFLTRRQFGLLPSRPALFVGRIVINRMAGWARRNLLARLQEGMIQKCIFVVGEKSGRNGVGAVKIDKLSINTIVVLPCLLKIAFLKRAGVQPASF